MELSVVRHWGSMYRSSGFKIQSAVRDQTTEEMKKLMENTGPGLRHGNREK